MRCLQIKGLAPNEIHAEMVATLKNDAPAIPTMKKWAAKFNRDRESFENDSRSRRPSTTTTIQENINRIQQMVMDDRRLTINFMSNSRE